MTEHANTSFTNPTALSLLKKRRASETRFRLLGISGIVVALAALVILLTTMLGNGLTAFQQTQIKLKIHFDEQVIDPEGKRDPKVLSHADYRKLYTNGLYALFPDVKSRRDKSELRKTLISSSAQYALRDVVLEQPELVGTTRELWLVASDDVDMYLKGYFTKDVPESDRPIKDITISWIEQLQHEGRIDKKFNRDFFTNGSSQDPEQAGILGALVGSGLTLLVTFLASFPVGLATAVYLEEFAPKNGWTDLIEVNINNLAAVPSIVFGLLGLAVFLNVMHMPRSAPVVGGLTLALMTLPTIIIATRAALKAVPPSLRDAARGLGASPLQVVLHHVVPLAMPGILTGTIIGMAQALGETAPLLMIGMVAFLVDIPHSATDAATVMPVQIYLWADSAERGFVEKTAAATLVLLGFLVLMNLLAVLLRKKFERRW
ncbi:phosphate ABC transporter membrane protein 2, PhoT family [Magnetococcus marinus MC-1]|uniref:Phosphate transport system permease protein PstA n=1 Tax=Magnetococcus marinus (strain ATCC BAA-1437 / JCM 17883 / MC-1) TaxID=156889 RepID=A0L7V6_MAGMM|nr:phosphate ABC transporter permease PstA [Magnetococcus marinus]ABK44049.1 phosphate ABC transporter membrane protein 2, PhoT family [Magnetococcus marinus MC-1]